MRSRSRPRGFTLIELVIAMAVAAIVLTGVIVASTAQQRSFHDGQRLRVAQGNARAALLYLEQKVALAGWGLDPALALDFQFYTAPASTCSAEVPCPASRDSTDNADELVFYTRNPDYWVPANVTTGPYKGRVWSLSAIAAGNVQLAARNGDSFPRGQILQAVCPGTLNYVYFTIGTTTSATADGDLTIPLQAAVASNPFRRQDQATSSYVGCRVFQIDRYRFHVRAVPQGGGRWIPYLVLDRGIDLTGASDGSTDNLVNDKDEVLVAEGIESFQVAYEFPNPVLGRAGATAATAITFSAANGDQTVTGTAGPDRIARTAFPGNAPSGGQTVYAPSSFYQYSFSDPMRQTFHQANIRAVQIALVARSPDPAADTPTNMPIDSTFRLFNQSGAPSWITGAPQLASGTDGYQRIAVNATIDLPNMTSRSLPGF